MNNFRTLALTFDDDLNKRPIYKAIRIWDAK